MRSSTVADVYERMREHQRYCAPNGECEHWQDYVDDTGKYHGMMPWDDRAHDTEAQMDYFEYWAETWSDEVPADIASERAARGLPCWCGRKPADHEGDCRPAY